MREIRGKKRNFIRFRGKMAGERTTYISNLHDYTDE